MLRNINEYLQSGEVEKIKVGANGGVMVTLEELVQIPKKKAGRMCCQHTIKHSVKKHLKKKRGSEELPTQVDIQCMGTDGENLYQMFYSYIADKWFYTPLHAFEEPKI